MNSSPDVLVIGGGIIGLTSAYQLAQAGRSVLVLDRQAPGMEASWAGAGIIPPGNPVRARTPIDRLRANSVSRFPQFSAELRERTGIDNGFLLCGGIEFLAVTDADVLSLWESEGIRFSSQFPSPLVGEGLGVRGLSRYHLPDCGQVRNPWHMRALIAACQQVGVRFEIGAEAIGWDHGNLRLADGTTRAAGAYLIAAGAWAERLLSPLGCTPGIHPIRGQIVLYRCSQSLFTQVLMCGKRYLVPRTDGRVLVGSTEEPEAGFVKANTPSGIAELRAFACDLVPGLADAEVEKCWAGLRPGSPDGMPYIGLVPGTVNVFAAVGHSRAGVQLSLGTATMIADMIAGRQPADRDAFRLDRTPELAAKTAFRS